MVADGGGTATRDKYMTPKNGSLYIGGAGVRTTEGTYSGTAYSGQSVGGGLIVIYADRIQVGETGKFSSLGKGINGSSWSYKSGNTYMSGGAGGGSGGGSINIFFNNQATGLDTSKFELSKAYSPAGTYNVGSIKTGTYEKLEVKPKEEI